MATAIDLVGARPWGLAAFTTYSLSLSFFESVMLDRLVRGGAREKVICADKNGVIAALDELGPREAARSYRLEPIANARGFFHAKVAAFIGDDDAHLLIGSGNLTFGGWGNNIEVVDHLHPSFAGDAFLDAADFYEGLTTAPRLQHLSNATFMTLAGHLRAKSKDARRDGRIRFLHNLERGLIDQIVELAEVLGGATRLVVASPYWDNGAAIDQLCTNLAVDKIHIHAPEQCVRGTFGHPWPVEAKAQVAPVSVEWLSDPERRLHAKVIEVLCRKGRIRVSGSANATSAALVGTRNVEACVVRIAPGVADGWAYKKAKAPIPDPAEDSESEEIDRGIEVLAATLNIATGELTGSVLAPGFEGQASLFALGVEPEKSLGSTVVSTSRTFTTRAEAMIAIALGRGRLTLRLIAANGRVAEGFVNAPQLGSVTRAAIAPHLFALLSATETPADIAAILSWFAENVTRLPNVVQLADHARDAATPQEGRTVPLVALTAAFAQIGSQDAGAGRGASDQNAWQAIMQKVLAAFGERRGRIEPVFPEGRDGDWDDEDDEFDGGGEGAPRSPDDNDPEALSAFGALDDLINQMTRDGATEEAGMFAYSMAQFLCERLEPGPRRALGWLSQVIEAVMKAGATEDSREVMTRAVVLWLAGGALDETRTATARGRLQRLGADLSATAPTLEKAGFASALEQTVATDEVWKRIQTARTSAECVFRQLRHAIPK